MIGIPPLLPRTTRPFGKRRLTSESSSLMTSPLWCSSEATIQGIEFNNHAEERQAIDHATFLLNLLVEIQRAIILDQLSSDLVDALKQLKKIRRRHVQNQELDHLLSAIENRAHALEAQIEISQKKKT